MSRRISGVASAVAVVALVVLAGCGGASQATSAGSDPSPTTVAAAPTTAVPVATTAAPTATTAVAPACPDVMLSSGPTDLASEIKVVGISCADAAVLLGKVGPQETPAGGPPRLDSDGWVCLAAGAHGTDHGPPSANFTCTSGAMKVSFLRS